MFCSCKRCTKYRFRRTFKFTSLIHNMHVIRDVKLFKVSSSNDSVVTSFYPTLDIIGLMCVFRLATNLPSSTNIFSLSYSTIWEASLICNYVWKINACDPIKIVSQSLYFSKSFLSAVYAFL